MSTSVTPQRRRRSIDDVDGGDDDDDDDDISVDGESPDRVSTPKRARPNGDGPLLPDTFRRSPKANGKGKSRAKEPGKYQPGSIVRVKLTNFVTYTRAEFHPGPNLNMIIGPNGTGKSTLVCAICLGLGSPTSLLGRAKDISEFIKHGAKQAEIEIELAADPDKHTQNPVVTAKISRGSKSADFWINGKKSSKKELEKLMRAFSIQIGNLCQFLPQDRVVEFAALNPVDLLFQTEQAAAPQYMIDWHEQLKVMRKEQKEKLDQQQNTTVDLKALEKRQNSQQADVTRLLERQQAQDRIAALEKLRPFPDYTVAIAKNKAAHRQKKTAEKELAMLEKQAEPNLLAEKMKQAYLNKVNDIVKKRQTLAEKSEGHADKMRRDHAAAATLVREFESELNAERESVKATKQELPRLRSSAAQIQRAMQNPPPEVDFAQLNQLARDKIVEARALEGRIGDIKTQMGSLEQQSRQQETIIGRAEQEKAVSQTQAGQKANKLRGQSRDAHTAWEWIQQNRNLFQTDVFGPPIVECSVPNARHAAAVETAIGASEMMAFTTTCREDFKMLQNQLYTTMRLEVNIRSVNNPLNSFRPNCSVERLQSFGLESYILQLIEGPEPVLAMLCDNRNIHATAFTSHNLPAERVEALKQPNSPITSWITPSESYTVARRREYGDKASSTRVQNLRPAKIFLDAPAAHQEDAELERRVDEAQRTISQLKGEYTDLKREGGEVAAQLQEVIAEEKGFREEKANKQRAQSLFAALPDKLDQANRKLSAAEAKIKSSMQKQMVIIGKGDEATLRKGQLALDYANTVEALQKLHIVHIEAQIIAIEAQSDLEQLQERTTAEKKMLAERKVEAQQLEKVHRETRARGEKLRETCKRLGDTFDDEGLHDVYEEIRAWNPDQLETEIQSMQARLDMTDGSGDQRVLKEYEARKKLIEERREQLEGVEAALEGLEASITEIQAQWEPQLDQIVAQISEAFAENFGKIQCAGEVGLHKDEDFEAWEIQIKVKFRERETLSKLDNHRQSGGERAVSTIFYLMALQSMARAPFRVVDEINQGMDPRNERLVHSRIVDIACSEASASQYFLITPKLLSGLKYHEGMKVHCIASGEYMPEDRGELDFGMLARRALAVRAAAAAG
ncbi:hypothetical protein LTR36_000460 [Oleoguttula mirabilis]|uniref:Structural maintenance of chromosomes protein 5 n=1 Tax=Oleoguttula mirabilis TaxID=1507867 RepID=A0AAV9JZ27_9PEZI|nr:hypothetical protein LTR36_000460 [Oleoguttula mirabilis]